MLRPFLIRLTNQLMSDVKSKSGLKGLGIDAEINKKNAARSLIVESQRSKDFGFCTY